jgi:murein DD-endopeptidase MepM/ murein hydrolase activator NlpD
MSPRRKKIPIFAILIVGVLAVFILPKKFDRSKAESLTSSTTQQDEIHQNIEIKTSRVEEGDVFTTTIARLDIGYSQALKIVELAKPFFDLARIRIGSEFRAIYIDEILTRIEYDISSGQMLIIMPKDGEFEVEVEDIAYTYERKTAEFTINSSLFLSGLEAGLDEGLIIRLANVFAWTIDFATQVQQGDSVSFLYELRFRDGKPAGAGQILAASFTNRNKEYRAFAFTNQEGVLTYYDQEGNSLIRQFLKAPLEYSRITSGYTYSRFHPVLKTNTPHRAIDYAAPTGTPIYAVADGTVTFAGWSGGYGNFIKIRHNSTYGTNYAHLSRFAVASGDRVRQGQTIGYVGSTGFSTGPHLHYEMTVNGQLVNPNDVDLPAGDPVEDSRRLEFIDRMNEYSEGLGW